MSSRLAAPRARLVETERRRIGEGFTLCEVGAGSGSLLGPLLDAVDTTDFDTDDFDVWAVEASPAARRALERLLPPERIVGDLDSLPAPISGVVLANELIDNLPMALAQRVEGEWRERWVGAEDDSLVFVDAAARDDVVSWLDRFAGDVPDSGWVEVQIEAAGWLEEMLGKIDRGSVVVIDYGDTTEGLLPRRRDGTLRTYRAHHLGPHPLDEPGATDITADVNFTALIATAEAAGFKAELHRQDDFLADLGLRDALSSLRQAELDAARTGDEEARLRIRSEKTATETLLHPRGLVDFRVLRDTR